MPRVRSTNREARIKKLTVPGAAMKKGFTLTELLVVVFIVTVLAAIIFPVAASVRERARRSSTLSNLQQIYIAIQQYKLDEQAFPPALFNYIVDTNGVGCGNIAAPPIDHVDTTGFLKPYLRSTEVFHSLNSPYDDRRILTEVYYPQGHALAGRMVRVDPLDNSSPPLCYYRYDSMNIGHNPGASRFELRYSLFWSNSALNQTENRLGGDPNGAQPYGDGFWDAPVGMKRTDTPRQLGYKNPDDSTVITWCSYHRTYSGGTPNLGRDDLALFLNGTAKSVSTRDAAVNSIDMFNAPYNVRP